VKRNWQSGPFWAAGRARLAKQLLTESLILTLAGGLLGLGVAYWGIEAIRALVPANTPRIDEVHIDPVVLGFTFIVSLLTGIIFGPAPAWHVAQVDLRESLNEAGRGNSIHRRKTGAESHPDNSHAGLVSPRIRLTVSSPRLQFGWEPCPFDQ
jgi:hypothetical protein